jgi:hypothetical protein
MALRIDCEVLCPLGKVRHEAEQRMLANRVSLAKPVLVPNQR